MSRDWAEETAQQLLSRDFISTGVCLVLGGADTGKTTFVAAMAKHAGSSQSIGIIDADIGQSHIGPPATVGWAIVNDPRIDFSKIIAGGISFVGDITPVGHLLQLTAAIAQSLQQVSKLVDLIIIDTPGFINGPAANVLWWTVQRIIQPQLILAVQRYDELGAILAGLRGFSLRIKLVNCPSQIPLKSPQDRKTYRQRQFSRYFKNSRVYEINLSDIAVQPQLILNRENLSGRLIALRDCRSVDIAMSFITEYQKDRNTVVIRAPQIDIKQICCLVIGDASVELTQE